MDSVGKTIQKHWPKIILGAAAIAAVGYGVYAKNKEPTKPVERKTSPRIENP